MNYELKKVTDNIIDAAIKAVLPDKAVIRALENKEFPGRVILVSVGKAAWQMANAASEYLGDRIDKGIVITKYGHVKGEIENVTCFEAGHPVPDDNSFKATQKVLDMVSDLKSNDTVLFLLSGGGSALFEKPQISGDELSDITNQLLSCGADIVEINTIRKRLSMVKGGRFAKICEPAHVYSIVLSDILGDPLDMIASGPACPDSTTCEDAKKIVNKYNLKLSPDAEKLMEVETPKKLDNVTTLINGSVRELCNAAAKECEKLSAASGIDGIKNAAIFSIGSDGTDGPTDAAGGYADADTAGELRKKGINIFDVLRQNDAYNALKETGGLIITGPTGTNVNDVAVLLIDCD